MNNTPLYAMTSPTMGAINMGAAQYGVSAGHQSNVSLLPPQYAGDMWDNITPWDTRSEKAAKEEAAAAEQAAFQERLAAITGNQSQPKQVSPAVLAVLGLSFAAMMYLATR